MKRASRSTTIGILYAGEMGAALGRLLAGAGYHVVTTVAGRSRRTVGLAAEAGLEVLDDLEEVVAASQVVLSLVPPGGALSIARQCAACAHAKADTLYIDANSIAPATARAVAATVERRGTRFVDAAIHGQARRLPEHGVIYLSGADAQSAAELFDGVVTTRGLGDEPGRASAMKMFMAGMSKGLVALFVEMALAAREESLLDEFLAGCSEFYPGVLGPVGRMLPTYPRHAARRAEEMSELEQTVRDLGLEPQIVAEARRLIARLAQSDLHRYAQAVDDGLFETDDLIELIALDNPLRPLETATEFYSGVLGGTHSNT